MLESLLVLGQVPGTNFEITFQEIFLSCYLLLLLYFYRRARIYARMDIQYFKLLLLEKRAISKLNKLGYSDGIVDSAYSLNSSRTYFSSSDIPGLLKSSFNRKKYLAT